MQVLIERTAREVLAVGTKGDGVHRVSVTFQRVQTLTGLHVPKLDGGVVRRGGEKEREVGILRAGARGAPFDGIYFLLVLVEVVHARVLLQAPHFCREVVRARREERSARIPLDGVHLVSVPVERLDGLVVPKFAHVDGVIHGRRGELRGASPVHIKRGRGVERELLLHVARLRVPHDGRLVHGTAEQAVARLVPLEGENRALVMLQAHFQLAIRIPNACLAIVRASREQSTVRVPVQRGDVALHRLAVGRRALLVCIHRLDAITARFVIQHLRLRQLRLCLAPGRPSRHGPHPRRAVSATARQHLLRRVPRAYENLARLHSTGND